MIGTAPVKFTVVSIALTLSCANLVVFRAVNQVSTDSNWEYLASSLEPHRQAGVVSILSAPTGGDTPSTPSAASSPPRIEHEINPQRPDWGKLSNLVRIPSSVLTPREYDSFFSSRDASKKLEIGEASPSAVKHAWTPPSKRPVFTEWSKEHRSALLKDKTDVSPEGRPLRFPSVDQRVRLYMSNWYHPPCSVQSAHHFESRPNASWLVQEQPSSQQVVLEETFNDRFLDVNSTVGQDWLFSMDEKSIVDCIENGPANLGSYCQDVQDSIVSALPRGSTIKNSDGGGSTVAFPLLLQFGDGKTSQNYGALNVPHIRKIRSVALDFSFMDDVSACHDSPRLALETLNENGQLQPVLWKLRTERHFGLLNTVLEKDDTTPWAHKVPKAVFRGALSGRNRDGYSPELDDLTNCKLIRRCRFVLDHDQSELVDARLSKTLDALPNRIDGVDVVDSLNRRLSVEDQLKYKAVIMIEGNDVSSGLKWALLSSSVVLMPAPTYTSWAMEEWLEPWVHYVPLKDDMSNAEEQMQWINNHDAEAQAISLRATLWMKDLVLHADAAADDDEIRRELLDRYSQHWAPKFPKAERNPLHKRRH